MVKTERLYEAGRTVAHVQAEENHRKDVPGRDVPNAEAGDHVVIDVTFFEIGARVDDAGGEMEQVIDDKAEEDGTAPIHGTRGVTGDNIFLAGVAFGACGVVTQGEADAGPDVEQHSSEERGADTPEQFGDAFEKVAVRIDFFGPFVDLQIAEHVADDENEKDHARDGHDRFLAIGGGQEARRALLADADDGGCHKFDCPT